MWTGGMADPLLSTEHIIVDQATRYIVFYTDNVSKLSSKASEPKLSPVFHENQ